MKIRRKKRRKMGRNQRDEPIAAHIADAATTQTTDESDHINAILVALENSYITLKS